MFSRGWATLLAFLLVWCVFHAWWIHPDLDRPRFLLAAQTTAHETPITMSQRGAGIFATYVGIGSAVGLGAIAIAGLLRRRGRRPWLGLLGLVALSALVARPVWSSWIEEAKRDPVYIEWSRVHRANRNDLKNLCTLYLDLPWRGKDVEGLVGKDAILSLLAHGSVSYENRDNLRTFFPDSEEASIPPGEDYAALTLTNLGERDFGHLTGYVGPRRGGPPTEGEGAPRPLFADVSTGRYAIVAFSNGSVRTLHRERLGLAECAPLVVGEDATSPLLRQLSDKSGP